MYSRLIFMAPCARGESGKIENASAVLCSSNEEDLWNPEYILRAFVRYCEFLNLRGR